jgi:chaperonin GroEL (HSP60 family)
LPNGAFLFEIFEIKIFLKQSFVGAIAVADLVKTTLGPKGMDKIL